MSRSVTIKIFGSWTELVLIELRQSAGGQVILNSLSAQTTGVQTLQLPDLGVTTGSATIAVTGASGLAQTFTNVSMSGSSNTFTNISLTTAVTGTLPIANGGTNGTTAVTGFNNLSPLTTAGDTLYYNGSNNVRLAAGTSTQVLHGGTTPSWAAVTLTTDVTGTLPIANGGTNATTAATAFVNLSPLTTAGDLIYENATPAPARLAIGTTNQVLTVVGGLPAWANAGGGTVTSVAVSGGTTGLTTSGGPITTSGTITLAGTLAVANGGTGVTSVTTTPTATAFAGWDANKNLSANSVLEGYTTTATAAGTTTLTVGSTKQQYFTGSSTQTVLLPVTSTLVLGQQYEIVNNSTGTVTVQSSGSNTILALIGSGTSAVFTVILTTGTTAASWSTAPGLSTNGVPGSTAGTAITTGYVGQVLTATVLFASAQSLTSGTTKDLVQLAVGPGTWAINGCVAFDGTGTTTVSGLIGAFGFNSATLPAQSTFAVQDTNGQITVGISMSATNTVAANDYSLSIPTVYVNKTGSDNYHLLVKAAFATSTLTGYGSITAVRIA